MGPIDYVNRFTSEFSERKSGNISAGLKMISGPLGQDVIDSIAYRRGLIELGATNLPYYGAYDIFFGEGTRQSLRKRARQLDKGILIPEEEENKNINLFGSGPITGRRKNEPRLFYDRGGIVKNVPNVKDEPDERVDKRTGQMYNSTSESAQDLSDRELKGQMEGLGLREPFVFGGLSMLSRKNLMRELTKTLNRRKKYEKDNMGNEREIDVDYELNPEEPIPFTTYEFVPEFPDELLKLREEIQNTLDKLDKKYYKNKKITDIKKINFDRNSDDRSRFILNHGAVFNNFHAKNPKSGETISKFIKEMKELSKRLEGDPNPFGKGNLPDIYNKLSESEITELEELFLKHNILYNKAKFGGPIL